MWDNGDLVTHEVMGGLKNVYAIGAGNTRFLFIYYALNYLIQPQKTCLYSLSLFILSWLQLFMFELVLKNLA